ncbi:hypothetical protein NPIL_456761 [Nephila pilipes]|uniref:Uncharacterized protein n=1 Tax=Nephila pilipes TaxID=299642 RepID=A0A8X6QY93_NEPPI|nr:hypothetical protein NPIL_456761 [Nephila pilipes]
MSSFYVLPKFRQVSSGILNGVKKELKADFRFIKMMRTDCNKSEVVHWGVWKRGVLFKILAVYSPSCNSPDISYVNHCKHTIFVSHFNVHSPMWYYSDTNEAEGRVQDFLSSSTFEFVYNKEDPQIQYLQTGTVPADWRIFITIHKKYT